MADRPTGALAAISTALYYASYPPVALWSALVLLVSPFYAIARFVLLPVTYAVHGILALALVPFRLRLLERLETIYIFLGIAALIGCLVGAALYLAFHHLSSTLNIDTAAEARARGKGRTTADYRLARRKRRDEAMRHAAVPAV